MLTLQDCMALSGLDEEEIDAIAEHEHIPEIAAAELGCCLLDSPAGRQEIKRMIFDDLVHACDTGNARRAESLRRVLSRYVSEHPDSV